jgi:hypothetical protein
MSVGGYLFVPVTLVGRIAADYGPSIKARSLPRFWYYSFHFMDYQKYAFELLTNVSNFGVFFRCSHADPFGLLVGSARADLPMPEAIERLLRVRLSFDDARNLHSLGRRRTVLP